MTPLCSRRSFVGLVSAFGIANLTDAKAASTSQSAAAGAAVFPGTFPAQDPALAKEIVAVSHGNLRPAGPFHG